MGCLLCLRGELMNRAYSMVKQFWLVKILYMDKAYRIFFIEYYDSSRLLKNKIFDSHHKSGAQKFPKSTFLI